LQTQFLILKIHNVCRRLLQLWFLCVSVSHRHRRGVWLKPSVTLVGAVLRG